MTVLDEPPAGIPLFRGISSGDLRPLLGRGSIEELAPGATLIIEGDRIDALYIVMSGAVRVVVGAGPTAHAFDLGPGACVGEMSLVTDEPASASVVALTPGRALRIQRAAFERALDEVPGLLQNLGAILAQRLRETSRRKIASIGTLVPVFAAAAQLEEARWFAHVLASSVVKHSRRATLLVDATTADIASSLPDLAALAVDPARMADHARVVSSGAEVHHVAGALAADRAPLLPTLLDGLCDAYHVVIALLPVTAPPLASLRARVPRAFAIAGPQAESPELAAAHGTLREGSVRVVEFVDGRQPTRRQELVASRRRGHPVALVHRPETPAIDRLAREVLGMLVGVALGAGGTRGFAHVGALEVLAASGVPIDCIAGTSIGSVVGSLWAFGHSADEIMAMVWETRNYLVKWTLPIRSLLSNRGIREHIERSAAGRVFEDSPIPLAVVAADIHDGSRVVLSEGEVAPAILASSSIPGVFPAVEHGGRYLVDGGICEPVPTTSVVELGAQITIGVTLGAQREAPAIRKPYGVLRALLRTNEIMLSHVNEHTAGSSHVLIAPQMAGGSLSLQEFDQADEFREAGRAAARAALPRLRELLPWLEVS